MLKNVTDFSFKKKSGQTTILQWKLILKNGQKNWTNTSPEKIRVWERITWKGAEHIKWQFSSVQSLSHVRLFANLWTAAHQASLPITNSQSSPKPMSTELVMPSNDLILCRPFLLLPSIFPSIRVFSNKSALHIRWPKYWSFSFNISPSNEHPGLISREMQMITKWVNHYISTRTLKIKMSDPTSQGWHE